MSTSPITRVVVIRNTQGLHARPAEMFVRLARKFQSRIELVCESRRVDARNIIDLLTLGAAQGTQLVIEADGDDAQEAVEALARLVDNGFPSEQGNNQQQVNAKGEGE